MKQGILFYDKGCGRYNFYYDEDEMEREYGGIHCGEVFEFNLNGVWKSNVTMLSSNGGSISASPIKDTYSSS